jgi:uncharacterized surface protein with fasciclin (FAS1) repeats
MYEKNNYKKNTILLLRPLLFLLLLLLLPGLIFAGGRKESKVEEGEKSYPFKDRSLYKVLESRGETRFMAQALENTGLAKEMEGLKGYTLFVPTDATVEKLKEIIRTAMMENPEALLTVLQAQMLKGVYDAEDLAKLNSVTTVGEVKMEVGKRGKQLTLNRSDIETTNLFGDGFVVHTVTGLIVPTISPR